MALSELPLISLELWGEICTHITHQSHSVGNTRVGLTDANPSVLLWRTGCFCIADTVAELFIFSCSISRPSSPAGDLHVCALS